MAPLVPKARVLDRFPQELVVEAVGRDVALFVTGELVGDSDPEQAVPDPVDLFVRAVNAQMFPEPAGRSCASRATVLDERTAPGKQARSWRLRLEAVHPASLRVLVNLLAARDLTQVNLQPAGADPQARPLDPAALPNPPARSGAPFSVVRENPVRAARDRLVQIELAGPPPDPLVDHLLAALDLWTNVLILGGYPPPGMSARDSGALPDGPLLLDEVTVQQAFPEAFQCDEAAFDAVINLAHCLPAGGPRVARVRIR